MREKRFNSEVDGLKLNLKYNTKQHYEFIKKLKISCKFRQKHKIIYSHVPKPNDILFSQSSPKHLKTRCYELINPVL